MYLVKIENKIKSFLAHHPFLYAVYGGIGVVLFWRGVWLGMDSLVNYYFLPVDGRASIDILVSTWDPLASFLVGTCILLSCGLFVSELIGKEIIISGLRGEKRLTERTETEVRTETGALAEVLERLDTIAVRLEDIESKHNHSQGSR